MDEAEKKRLREEVEAANPYPCSLQEAAEWWQMYYRTWRPSDEHPEPRTIEAGRSPII